MFMYDLVCIFLCVNFSSEMAWIMDKKLTFHKGPVLSKGMCNDILSLVNCL